MVVLGGGMGGLAASSLLVKQAPKASITIVEQRKSFEFPPSYPLVALGMRRPKQVQRDLSSLRKKKIRIVNARVKSIEPSSRLVRTDSQEIQFDHLIIALGTEYSPEDVSGFEEYAQQFYDLGSAMKLHDALGNFAGETIAVGVTRTPFRCPAAPYEMALMLEDRFKRMKKKVRIEFFTPEPQPIPAAGVVLGRQVERLLESRGIKYHPKEKVSRIEDRKILFDSQNSLAYDLLVAVPPHRCPKPVVDAGLTDSSGWVPVSPQTLATKFENVYAIGDVTAIETPHGHVPFLPKAGTFANGQAAVVANNISQSINGKGERKVWDGTGSCFLDVSISETAYLQGRFLANPPVLEFHPPRRKWHNDRMNEEKQWMSKWF